ncbi:MAG: CoA-binding protein [Candidatus Omnitrophica bacterium]|nr:CoA-binding protein [Candidatus Omnitrophota bacterium]
MSYKDKNIAVMGVSSREEKFGHRIFRDLLNSGYKVYGVNPGEGEVLGKKIYRSLKDIPGKIDLVIIVVPAQVTEKAVDTCKELGIKEIWMQPGSESDLAVQSAKKYGIAVTYNSCFMVEEGIW